jgi:hypothetical protein
MKTNTNYCNKTNLPCYRNAQHWYYINALNKVKSVKNPKLRAYYYSIVLYYTNNKYKSIQYR